MLEESVLEKFRGGFHGQVIIPSDNDYESARKVWNGMIDKHPALIAKCKDENDVVSAINFARTNRLTIAVRGGGHNVAGFGTCDDGIVIDLSNMKAAEVDPEAKTIVAGPELTWGEFDKATQAHGLATTGGLVTTTGIAGFTLGGGFGWLVRKLGLTIDNLLSAEVCLQMVNISQPVQLKIKIYSGEYAEEEETSELLLLSNINLVRLDPRYMAALFFTQLQRQKNFFNSTVNGHQQHRKNYQQPQCFSQPHPNHLSPRN